MIEIKTDLTKTEFNTLYRVMKDVFEFSKFIYVIHPLKGKVHFNLFPFQVKLLYYFLTRRFNIVLKFRQAGVTELIAMYSLWLAMYHPNKTIQIISIKDRVAKKVLRKIKFMYRNLPEYLKVPIQNGRSGELGCVTRDTVLVGDHGDFEIGTITPPNKGWIDISHLGLKVLTHEGTFERILKSVNKGELETWEIENERGNKIRCTWNHQLLTPQGWKTVKEILEKNLTCIFWDTYYLDDVKVPNTELPTIEIIKETRFKGYFVSNWGKVYSNNYLKRKDPGKLYRMSTSIKGVERVKLKGEHNGFYAVHRLVWETFKGKIPDNCIIDHIDCNRGHNWLTNLQAITHSENTKRAYKYNRSIISNNFRLTNLDIQTLGRIRELDEELGSGYGTGAKIALELGLTTKEVSHYRRGLAGNYIYTSKIKRLGITREIIVDLEVENAHSYITKSEFVNHNTVTELEFINGSIITSIPTTEDAGRSEALSLLVIDEAAIVKWANRIWAAAFPTLSTGGSAIVNSTPYGVGNWYHSEWVKACASSKSQEEFTPIKLRWQMHPERDQAWYDAMKKHLGPRRTAQEIDGDFLTSGNSVFDLLDIREIEEALTEIDIIERKFNGCFNRVYLPVKDMPYFIGADISTGRSRDYSAFSVQSSTGVEHAYFKGKLPVDKLANLLMEEGKKYNFAVIAPETNDVGLAVTSLIQNAGYPNLYYSTKMVKEKGERKPKQEKIPGWMTTMKNRPIIINELERDISNGLVEINNPFFVQEAYTFIYDERNRPIALGKGNIKDTEDMEEEETFTDDAILSTSITNFIRKGRSTTIVIPPK